MLLTANENRILVIEITSTDADGLLRNYSHSLLCCSPDAGKTSLVLFCWLLFGEGRTGGRAWQGLAGMNFFFSQRGFPCCFI